MSSEEMLDTFNEQRVHTGSASRRQVHAEGLWHQTFQCWVVNIDSHEGKENPGLLFQLRAEDKEAFPGKLDISCAGHLLAGESPQDGIRELEEELGLIVAAEDLIYCGTVAQESGSELPVRLIDREFNHVFLYPHNRPLDAYRFQISEVSGLFWIGLKEYKALLSGEQENIWTREGIVHHRIDGSFERVNREVTLDHFTPNSEAYYRLLFDALDKLMGTRA